MANEEKRNAFLHWSLSVTPCTDINERDLQLLDIFWGEQATEKTRLEAYQTRM